MWPRMTRKETSRADPTRSESLEALSICRTVRGERFPMQVERFSHRCIAAACLVASVAGRVRTAWLAVGDALHSTRLQPSEDTRTSAAGHDAAVPTCLDVLLHTDAASVCLLWLPHSPSLCHGGFGLRNAEHHAVVAYRASWTSWADALPVSRVETVPPLKPSHVFRMALGLCLTLWLPTSCRLPRPHVGCCAAPLCHETTTPPTVYVGGSAPLHALLTSSGTVPSAVSLVLHALLRWTRSRAFTPRFAAIIFTTRPARLSCPSARRSSACCSRLRLSLLLTSAHCRCRQLHDLVGDIRGQHGPRRSRAFVLGAGP